MDEKISREAKREVLEALRKRYIPAAKREKAKILDEFVALSRYHRKHVVRLFGQRESKADRSAGVGRRLYDEAVKQALVIVWEAADRICGKRLRVILPALSAVK